MRWSRPRSAGAISIPYGTEMTPAEKRATWRRITREGTAWRFNHYAERATESAAVPIEADPSAAAA